MAIIDARDSRHAKCADLTATTEPPLVTTWPCFTEAMFLVRKKLGWPGEAALWEMVERATLLLMDLDLSGRARAARLMETYRDLPMSLADASLVATAEVLQVDTVFTLDSH
ncbi:MAG: type II toxin-antitoxin system VapC family toxin, partial [Candidatus Dormibacteria bacterium]